MTHTPVNIDDRIVTKLPPDAARAIVSEAIRSHFDAVRARIPGFVERTFSWGEAWRINRRGIGRDLYRAPLNATLVLPHFLLRTAAFGFERAGRIRTAGWLRSRQLFLKTDVAREVEWRVWTELLELPYKDGQRVSTRDGLAEAILRHPALEPYLAQAQAAYRRHLHADAIAARVDQNFAAFGESRAAANEVSNAILTLSAGAMLLGKFTPSVLTFGPALATAIAQNLAGSALPSALTGLWLGIVPVKASAALTVGVTGAAFLGAAAATAVSGTVTDPVQRIVGLHERRLTGLVDAIEAALLGDNEARLVAHDHYLGRVIDVIDLLTAAARYAPRF